MVNPIRGLLYVITNKPAARIPHQQAGCHESTTDVRSPIHALNPHGRPAGHPYNCDSRGCRLRRMSAIVTQCYCHLPGPRASYPPAPS